MVDKQDKPEKQMQPQPQVQGQEANADAVAMLKADHRRVEELFSNFDGARTRAQKAQIAMTICNELKIHSELEEKYFYPAVREAAEADDKLDEAQVEHDTVKLLVREIEAEKPEAPFYEAKVTVLKEYVKHHVGEEEAPDGILAQAQKSGIDLNALGQTMAQRKQELQADPKQLQPQPVSLRLATSAKEKSAMPNNGMRGGGRGRDDQGRFTSSRDYDDDRGRRSSSRYDDDDDRRGGGRGQGGWFGDSEGHSEASRRGWDERERGGRSGSSGGGSRGYDDDRGGRRSSARYDDDDDDRRGGGRGQGGWFGDPEGHSEASRRGWDDRERGGRSASSGGGGGRGQGGWFGDPEGHSEASRRGWEDRGRGGGSRAYDDDDRGRSSRSSRRDDDDDRGRGRGGWFGDSRGHSEAARRGWEDRR